MITRFLLAAFTTVSLLSADTLILRSGRTVDGTFIGGDNRTVHFLVGDRVSDYNVTDIGSISFGNGAPPPPPPQAYNAPPPPANNDNPYNSQTSNYPPPQNGSYPQADNNYPPQNNNYPAAPNSPYLPAAPAAPSAPNVSGMQIPAGAQVSVRLIDPVNSDTDRVGQTYRASIDDPVIVNGQTVIPRDADAVVTLVGAQQAGRIEGTTSLHLALRNVTVNGRSYDVNTTSVVQAGQSRSKRSAEVIGGTAVLGAVIGALAGGGRGAAVGAVSGGAVGTAAQVYTSGDKVRVPSETRLTFTLQNPLAL